MLRQTRAGFVRARKERLHVATHRLAGEIVRGVDAGRTLGFGRRGGRGTDHIRPRRFPAREARRARRRRRIEIGEIGECGGKIRRRRRGRNLAGKTPARTRRGELAARAACAALPGSSAAAAAPAAAASRCSLAARAARAPPPLPCANAPQPLRARVRPRSARTREVRGKVRGFGAATAATAAAKLSSSSPRGRPPEKYREAPPWN